MSDIYQKWNEQGILRKKLLSISFLVNAGVPIKDVNYNIWYGNMNQMSKYWKENVIEPRKRKKNGL